MVSRVDISKNEWRSPSASRIALLLLPRTIEPFGVLTLATTKGEITPDFECGPSIQLAKFLRQRNICRRLGLAGQVPIIFSRTGESNGRGG